jgi:hypothetical protein
MYVLSHGFGCFSIFSARGIYTGMTVHSRLKTFSFAKLIHYCTEKYLYIHLSQVHVGGSTPGATYVHTPGFLASSPSAGGLGGAWLTRVRPPSKGVRAASSYYVLGCDCNIVRRSNVRYIWAYPWVRCRAFLVVPSCYVP